MAKNTTDAIVEHVVSNRDTKIADALDKGANITEVARKFNVSEYRAKKILKEHKDRLGE